MLNSPQLSPAAATLLAKTLVTLSPLQIEGYIDEMLTSDRHPAIVFEYATEAVHLESKWQTST